MQYRSFVVSLMGLACLVLFPSSSLACDCGHKSSRGFLCEAQCGPTVIHPASGSIIKASSRCYMNTEGDYICPETQTNLPSAPAPSPSQPSNPVPVLPSNPQGLVPPQRIFPLPAPPPPATAASTTIFQLPAGTASTPAPSCQASASEGQAAFDTSKFTRHLYVAPTGSDSNPGTRAAPFKTITKASSAATAGTAVHVAPGTYPGGLTTAKSGTASARIAYISDVKWGAKIVPAANSTRDVAWRNSGAFVDIVGFDVDGSRYQGGTKWRIGLTTSGNNSSIQGNHVHRLAHDQCTPGVGGAGISTASAFWGARTDVIGNVVHDVGPKYVSETQKCLYIQGIYFQTEGSVKNNVAYNIGYAGIGLSHDVYHADIVNNTLVNNASGIHMNGAGFYRSPTKMIDYMNISNNIAVGNKRYAIRTVGGIGSHNTYTNNLSYNNAMGHVSVKNGTATGTLIADPQFMNAAAHDYRLKPTSPAIDKGLATYAPSTDLLGGGRPSGRGIDLGAYEAGATPASSCNPAETPGPAPTIVCTPAPAPSSPPPAGGARCDAHVPTTATGAVYYVDAQAGNDSNNGRGAATAWRTLDKALSRTYGAGERLLLHRGQTFASSAPTPILRVAGTAAAPVVVDTYGAGVAPRLDNTANGSRDKILQVEGNYAVIRNLSFVKANASNKTAFALFLNGNGHCVTKVDVSGTGMGIQIVGSDHRVDHSKFHDLNMVVADTSNPDNDFGATAVQLSEAHNISINHNVFENLSAPSPDYGVDGSAVEFFDSASNVHIHHNIARNVNAFSEIGGSSASKVVSGIRFDHNLVVNATSVAHFHIAGGDSNFGITARDVRFEHNTFVKNNTKRQVHLIAFSGTPAANQFFFRNNIADYSNADRLFWKANTMVHQNNLYKLTSAVMGEGFSLHSSERMGDPLFVAPASGSYQLKAGSPAIDRGQNLQYTTDLNNNARVAGAAPDLGAYESGSTPAAGSASPTPTPTAAPTLICTEITPPQTAPSSGVVDGGGGGSSGGSSGGGSSGGGGGGSGSTPPPSHPGYEFPAGFGCQADNGLAGPPPVGQNPTDWKMTFMEEFNAFDPTVWNDTIWYEQPNATQNYLVEGGALKIWPQRDGAGQFFNRTIDTDGKYYQTYGYFEMEAKLPIGKGVWPAFWLFNHIGNRRPEMDVMEAYPGGGPNGGWGDSNLHPVAFAATVWQDANQNAGSKTLQTSDLALSFHTYAVKWEPNKQTYYFDGNPFYELNVSMPDPMYIMLDLWFGSASGTPDNSTPQGKTNSYTVNYVRAWQNCAGGGG